MPLWGNFEYDHAKALTKLGHQVVMASVDMRFSLKRGKWGLTISKDDEDGIHKYNLCACPEAIIKFFLGEKIKEKIKQTLWRKVENLILQNEESFDIIYPHYLKNTYKAVTYLQNSEDTPIVAIEHWSEINKSTLAPYVQKMGEEVYPKVNKLLTVSKAAQKAIKEHFHMDSLVVYNMVGEKFRFTPRKYNNETVHFIATGSLIYRKGFDLLIEALAKLQLPKDKWELNIIGSGKEHDNLQKQIAKHDLNRYIHFVGQQTAEQIMIWMNNSDAFVLPSRMETFGVVYIEAMACGLPVIATPCGGPEEYVNAKNGLLVPIDDVDALAAAIQHMYEHHQDYDRIAIADDCKARFSSEVIAKKLTTIFEEVIAKQ